MNPDTRSDADALLTPQDVSAMLGVPVGTLYGWNHKGYGPSVRKIGRHIRYRLSEVNEWIDAQELRKP